MGTTQLAMRSPAPKTIHVIDFSGGKRVPGGKNPRYHCMTVVPAVSFTTTTASQKTDQKFSATVRE